MCSIWDRTHKNCIILLCFLFSSYFDIRFFRIRHLSKVIELSISFFLFYLSFSFFSFLFVPQQTTETKFKLIITTGLNYLARWQWQIFSGKKKENHYRDSNKNERKQNRMRRNWKTSSIHCTYVDSFGWCVCVFFLYMNFTSSIRLAELYVCIIHVVVCLWTFIRLCAIHL